MAEKELQNNERPADGQDDEQTRRIFKRLERFKNNTPSEQPSEDVLRRALLSLNKAREETAKQVAAIANRENNQR